MAVACLLIALTIRRRSAKSKADKNGRQQTPENQRENATVWPLWPIFLFFFLSFYFILFIYFFFDRQLFTISGYLSIFFSVVLVVAVTLMRRRRLSCHA